MKTVETKGLGILNAQNFEKAVANSFSNVYVMLSRSVGWANTSNAANLDDSTIEVPYDTVDYKNNLLSKGIILKRVTSADMHPVIPRIDWETGTTYTPYDHTANLYVNLLETALSGGNVNVANAIVTTTNVTSLNLAFSTPAISAGDIIRVGDEKKEIISITANGESLTVNSEFASSYTSNTIYRLVDYFPSYAYKFYVRNTADQVFKCLFNNGNVASTIMPEITLGGDLPESPYVETSDGYKWKYMYTIPGSLKNRFFTSQYMPVVRDTVVYNNRGEGRIDIVQIINGGNGYFAGSTQNNYSILSVNGDGTGANLSVDISNGVITEVNIIDGGENYSNIEITIGDPLKLPATANANLRPVISPALGHGSDPVRELGAADLMLSVDFQGDVSEKYPTKNDGTTTYRQVCLVNNPLVIGTTAPAYSSIEPMYTKLFVSSPSVGEFPPNSYVYVGNVNDPTFLATVIYFDSVENIIYVNDIQGSVDAIEGETVYQLGASSNYAQVFSITEPNINIFSGEILYIENRSKISRHPEQTETVKIVLEF